MEIPENHSVFFHGNIIDLKRWFSSKPCLIVPEGLTKKGQNDYMALAQLVFLWTFLDLQIINFVVNLLDYTWKTNNWNTQLTIQHTFGKPTLSEPPIWRNIIPSAVPVISTRWSEIWCHVSDTHTQILIHVFNFVPSLRAMSNAHAALPIIVILMHINATNNVNSC